MGRAEFLAYTFWGTAGLMFLSGAEKYPLFVILGMFFALMAIMKKVDRL